MMSAFAEAIWGSRFVGRSSTNQVKLLVSLLQAAKGRTSAAHRTVHKRADPARRANLWKKRGFNRNNSLISFYT
jgi:hypothetical protein